MVCDGLTKLSTKSPSPNLDLLLHVLSTSQVRITYCEGSWKKELQNKKGPMKELEYPDPVAWNPEGYRDYDTDGRTCRQDVVAKEQ